MDRAVRKSRAKYQEDLPDKENLAKRANIKDIKDGLKSSLITYDDLEFSKELLRSIKFDKKRNRSASRDNRKRAQNSRAIKASSRNALKMRRRRKSNSKNRGVNSCLLYTSDAADE